MARLMGFEDQIACDYEVLEQYSFEKIKCKCVTPEELDKFDKLTLSLLHLNIRSLVKHHNDLLTLLAIPDYKFDIIGCSETWTNERSCMNTVNLDGYTLYHRNRKYKPGGGVCLDVNTQMRVIE